MGHDVAAPRCPGGPCAQPHLRFHSRGAAHARAGDGCRRRRCQQLRALTGQAGLGWCGGGWLKGLHGAACARVASAHAQAGCASRQRGCAGAAAPGKWRVDRRVRARAHAHAHGAPLAGRAVRTRQAPKVCLAARGAAPAWGTNNEWGAMRATHVRKCHGACAMQPAAEQRMAAHAAGRVAAHVAAPATCCAPGSDSHCMMISWPAWARAHGWNVQRCWLCKPVRFDQARQNSGLACLC